MSVTLQPPSSRLTARQSPWEPLGHPVYRAFWIASLASNLGTWVHEVGAGWLMTSLDASPEMVSAVRTSMAVPVLLLAIPAGVLADRVDRRRLLLATQFVLLVTALGLALLTFTHHISAWGLLTLTSIIGLGMVVHVPTWQASIPELVPRDQLPRAVALGSISFNLARSAGPAVGGLIIASVGVWCAFAFNAASFAGVILVLALWKRERTESTRGLSFRLSLIQGLRYIARSRPLRHVIVGVVLFVLPGSALWSLLPLVARERLDWGARGFGLLVTSVGVGAVFAASIMPRLIGRFGRDGAIGAAMLVYAAGLGLLSQSSHGIVAITSTLLMGVGWMITLTTLNTTAQVLLPRRMRARGMGCYLSAMAFSMSLGSLVWGRLAGATTIETSLAVAAVVLVSTAVLRFRFRLEPAI